MIIKIILDNKRKRTCRIVDFAISTDRTELNESEKKDKYLDLDRGTGKNSGKWKWWSYQLKMVL